MSSQTGIDPAALENQLSRNSTPYRDPLANLDWSRLEHDGWWLPETSLSIQGLSQYESLTPTERRQVSRAEFLHIVNAGLWLESLFMLRLSKQLTDSRISNSEAIYHLHELREESGHSLMFLELFRQAGYQRPTPFFSPRHPATLLARFAPVNSFLFWSSVLIAEEISDRLNRQIKSCDAVCPVVRQLVKLHMIDEARHIAHAREVISKKLSKMGRWKKRIYSWIFRKLVQQFSRRFFYPDREIYEIAGLKNPRQWERQVKKDLQRMQFVHKTIASVGKPVLE